MENKIFTTMEKARDFIKEDGMNLQYITNWLSLLPCSKNEEDAKRNYVELAILAVTNVDESIDFCKLNEDDVLNHHPLEWIDSSISNEDYEKIAMAAVSYDPYALKFVKRFRRDFNQNNHLTIKDSLLTLDLNENNELSGYRQIVIEAIKNGGWALVFAPDELKKDKEIVIVAVNQDGFALQYASDNLKNDKEIVHIAVKQNAQALLFASDELRKDKKIVLEAILQNPYLFRDVSNKLRDDYEFILSIINLENQNIDSFSILLEQIKLYISDELIKIDIKLDTLKEFKDELDYKEKQTALLDKFNCLTNLIISLSKKLDELHNSNNLKKLSRKSI